MKPSSRETGGITILVALMMLVLLTLAAVGMSRNSFREIVNSGFSRQGAMAREVSDSGLEWAMYWISLSNSPNAVGPAASLNNEINVLIQNPTQAGVAKDIISGSNYTPGGTLQAGMEVPGPAGTTQGFTIGLTAMGQPGIQGMSQGIGQGSYAPATAGTGGTGNAAPYLWAVRSDAQVQQGNVTFIHGREAWISSPVNQ
jgi:Tfp pilus assembly protein PilX